MRLQTGGFLFYADDDMSADLFARGCRNAGARGVKQIVVGGQPCVDPGSLDLRSCRAVYRLLAGGSTVTPARVRSARSPKHFLSRPQSS